MFKGIVCPLSKKKIDLPALHPCQNCKNPCVPRPVIKALISEKVFKDDVFSVTELTMPIRIIYLRRKYDYYVSPYSLVNTGIGLAVHKAVEDKGGGDKRYLFEKDNAFEVGVEGVKISGTPDLYDTLTNTLYDHKVVGLYKAEKIKRGEESGYNLQLNAYRIFKFPQAKAMKFVVIIKDFSPSSLTPSISFPIILVNVPKLDDELVKKTLVNKAKAVKQLLKEGGNCPICSKEERWNGRLCDFYCDVREFCQLEIPKGGDDV